MKILFTGDYLTDYNRTTIIKAGLKKLGHEIVEFSFDKKNKSTSNKIKKLNQDCDFVYMPSFTHREVRLVRDTLGQHQFILFDPLISRYLTKIFDYKLAFKYGLSALRNYYRDRWSMEAASFVLTDTEAHKVYFNQTFKIPLEKMGVLYIGNNFDQYDKLKIELPPKSKFRVGFYGGFIPLQGIMNILMAAEILSSENEIEFYLIGSGFEFEKATAFVKEKKLKNVILPGWVPEAQLPSEIQKFDLALGIFGGTQKSDLVIPNKIYHYGSCGKAVITQRSQAIVELFIDKKEVWLVDCNPEEIAKTILLLKSNESVRKQLGINIYTRIRENHSETQVAQKFIQHYLDNKSYSS